MVELWLVTPIINNIEIITASSQRVLRVLPEGHVAVGVEDAVEPGPAWDGGGGRGRRGLPPHRQQRRSLRHLRLLLILGGACQAFSWFEPGFVFVHSSHPPQLVVPVCIVKVG